jgi:hypothetical protein
MDPHSVLRNYAIMNVKVLLTVIITNSSFALEDYNLWFEASVLEVLN